MDDYFNDPDSPPDESWLFAQAILGKPIPRIVSPEARARTHRAELERLAPISTQAAQELRELQAKEAEARRDRELLEWTAQFSTEAEKELRALQQKEQQDRRAWQAAQRFAESLSPLTEWNEVDHPRAPKGTSTGGQWVSKGGGGDGASSRTARSPGTNERPLGQEKSPSPRMLELAHAWWQSKAALEQARRDMQQLPRRIASERAMLGTGGKYAYIHSQKLAKARRDLEAAKTVAPELEKQLRDLAQEYHDAGFDEVPYATFTPAETVVGGKGIEEVGRAVARSGKPAGLRPTGIEFDIAAGALAAPAILRLGKAVLGKAALSTLPTRQRALLGRAASKNYRKTFFDAHPDRQGKVIVHHGIEQRVLKKYPGVVTESELHSLENLRGIPKTVNSEIHLKAIRKRLVSRIRG